MLDVLNALLGEIKRRGLQRTVVTGGGWALSLYGWIGSRFAGVPKVLLVATLVVVSLVLLYLEWVYEFDEDTWHIVKTAPRNRLEILPLEIIGESSAPEPRRSFSLAPWVASAMVSVVLLTGAALLAYGINRARTIRVGVLPFATSIPVPQPDGYAMAIGLREGISTIEGTAVADVPLALRSSKVREIGRELNVRYLVAGVIESPGGRLQVRHDLYDTRSGRLIERVTHAGSAISAIEYTAIQNAIVASLVRRLHPWISRAMEKAFGFVGLGTGSTVSYRNYAEGRRLLDVRSFSTTSDAIAFFQAALRDDSTYVKAWAGLAEAHALLGHWSQGAPVRALAQFDLAANYARTALATDPRSPEALTALSLIKFYREWDLRGARDDLRRATDTVPTAYARVWLADVLSVLGRRGESISQSEKAREASSGNPVIAVKYAQILLDNGDPREAAEVARSVIDRPGGCRDPGKQLEYDGNVLGAYVILAKALSAQGDHGGAQQRLDAGLNACLGPAPRILGEAECPMLRDPDSELLMAGFLAAGADTAAADRRMRCARTRYVNDPSFPAYKMATFFAQRQKPDSAIVWLRTAFARKETDAIYARVEPAFNRLRGYGPFTAVVDSVGRLHDW